MVLSIRLNIFLLFFTVAARPPHGHHHLTGSSDQQHDSGEHWSPTNEKEFNDWADSLFDEDAFDSQHQQLLSSPTRSPTTFNSPPSLDRAIVDQTSTSQNEASLGTDADWLTWIEGMLMNEEDENMGALSAFSGLDGASSSIQARPGHLGISEHTHEGKPKRQKGPLKGIGAKYRKRWTHAYNHAEQENVRNAVDLMVFHKFGPSDPKIAKKRRDNLILRLSEEQIDQLAKGEVKEIPSKRSKQRQMVRKKTMRNHWTKGLHDPDIATINRFMETEVMPFRKGVSRKTKNNLIGQLSREELIAIKNNNHDERIKIIGKLTPYSPNYVPRKRPMVARPFPPDQYNHGNNVGSPTAQMDLDKWADSLLVDEPAAYHLNQHYHSSPIRSSSVSQTFPHQSSPQHRNVRVTTLSHNRHESLGSGWFDSIPNHLSPSTASPEHRSGLLDNTGQATSTSHDHTLPSPVADRLKWIEDELMKEPDHDIGQQIPASISSSPARNSLSPSSGLSNAGSSNSADSYHDDHSTTTPIEQQRRPAKPQKKRWTMNYDASQQQRVRDAVDSVAIQRMGPADSKTMQKRRFGIISKLSEREIDELANGKSIKLGPWAREPRKHLRGQPQHRSKTFRSQWTKGLKKASKVAINQFLKEEVMPHLGVSSSSSKNGLIRRLTRSELLAIQDNNEAEKIEIIEKLKPYSPNHNSRKTLDKKKKKAVENTA